MYDSAPPGESSGPIYCTHPPKGQLGQEPVLNENPPSAQSSPLLTPDNDSESVCSDRCSQKTCSDCCDKEDCLEQLATLCAGFVDCDDANACTRPDCIEVDCRHIAPPCFDTACLQSMTDEDIAAAGDLGSTSQYLPAQSMYSNNQNVANLFDDYYQHNVEHGDSQIPGEAYSFHHSQPPLPATGFSQRGGADAAEEAFSYPPSKRRKASTVHYDSQPQDYNISGSSLFGKRSVGAEHGDNLFYCQWGNNCDRTFVDWSALDEHIYSNHVRPQNEMPCQWDNCQQPTDPSSIITHVKNDHTSSRNEPVCLWSDCTSQLPGFESLESHFRSTHLPANPLYCQWESCGALADDPSDLQMHLQTDHFLDPTLMPIKGRAGPEPSKDGQCICEWLTPVDREELSEAKPCGQTFANPYSLQEHMKEAHLGSLRRKTGYFCQWESCSRRGTQPFAQKGKLERHIQVHTGYKSCQCSVCGKDFSGPQALQQHERTHTGEKPYKCDICGKHFAQGSALTMHKRTHTKEKPLKCDHPGCNKTFSESSNLSKHKKTHELVGKHRCEIPGCERSFHRLDQLKRHGKTHTERPTVPNPVPSATPPTAGLNNLATASSERT